MPKFTVTQNMGAALRNLRQRRNFKAITLAKSINKTGAYITKLEKGDLNTIDREDLVNIIYTMSNNEEEFDEALRDLLSDTTMEFSDEEEANEEWKMNLDLFYRKIPISEKYIYIVKDEIEKNNISTLELSNYICSNFDLYNDKTIPKDLLDNSPKNKWIFNKGNSFAVMSISKEVIDDIINGVTLTSNYSILICILISLLRLSKISKDEAYEKASNIFRELKIYTLSELENTMECYDKEQSLNSLYEQRNNKGLPPEHITLINNLYEFSMQAHSFSEIYDIVYANKKLMILNKNFTNDPVLLMGYLGVDLTKLHKIDFQIKKEFVEAVSDLVDKFSLKIPKEEKHELI